VVGFVKLVWRNFAPVIMQDIIAERPHVFMGSLVARFRDDTISGCRIDAFL
jgi:hypothetical protein